MILVRLQSLFVASVPCEVLFPLASLLRPDCGQHDATVFHIRSLSPVAVKRTASRNAGAHAKASLVGVLAFRHPSSYSGSESLSSGTLLAYISNRVQLSTSHRMRGNPPEISARGSLF
jgi:hypothetical protein